MICHFRLALMQTDESCCQLTETSAVRGQLNNVLYHHHHHHYSPSRDAFSRKCTVRDLRVLTATKGMLDFRDSLTQTKIVMRTFQFYQGFDLLIYQVLRVLMQGHEQHTFSQQLSTYVGPGRPTFALLTTMLSPVLCVLSRKGGYWGEENSSDLQQVHQTNKQTGSTLILKRNRTQLDASHANTPEQTAAAQPASAVAKRSTRVANNNDVNKSCTTSSATGLTGSQWVQRERGATIVSMYGLSHHCLGWEKTTFKIEADGLQSKYRCHQCSRNQLPLRFLRDLI